MVNRNRHRILQIGLAASSLLIGATQAAPSGATTSVTFGVYVPVIVRWLGASGNAASFVVDGARPEVQESSHVFQLALNVDVALTAKVTPFTNTVNPSDVLDTEWKVVDDSEGNGRRSGALASDARPDEGYGNFVSGGDFLRHSALVTHQRGDGNVRFRVTARARRTVDDKTTNDPTGKRYVATIVLTAIPQPAVPTSRRLP
jgi:hypothetical protein